MMSSLRNLLEGFIRLQHDSDGNLDESFSVEMEYEYGPQIPLTVPVEGATSTSNISNGWAAWSPHNCHPILRMEIYDGKKNWPMNGNMMKQDAVCR